jgi:xanthine dehydrogenase YagR molybdenum-binding subunit
MKGVIGQPIDRVDGPLKVTGRATYAYEYAEGGKPAHGYVLGAAIARGRIAGIDTTAAERAPGVLHVMTHRNAPAQAEFGPPTTPQVADVFVRARPVFGDARVRYYDEPVALIVAETFEAARAAARLVRIRYAEERGEFDVRANLDQAYKPGRTNAGFETDSSLGDFDGAFSSAPVRIDATYTTPYQSHNPMEPHATLAVWNGDELTLYTSTQTIASIQAAVAATLRIPRERVRVVSHYTGGGFGDKLIAHADAVAAALAARVVRRPVKVALTRQQMFANTGHRPMMIQKVRLGAGRDGRLAALAHEVWSQTARYEEFAEQTAVFTRSLYTAPNRLTRHRLVPLDLHRGEWMRAPGEAPGMLAFESAMDELAERVGLDPIELRVRNEPELDPERKVPFSSRGLIACMREGAARFGWARRNPRPASVREGRLLIGHGMAAAMRPNYLRPAQAEVHIDANARVTARLDMTDIGTGSYTVLTQIVAESLGVPLADIRVELGDSRFPRTPGSGGSFGAASAGSALYNACAALKQRIVNGIPPGGLSARGEIAPGETYKTYSQHAFGAHFAEVAIDCDTGEIRLRRMLGVFAAGRILNAKTARSQMIGGMIWGAASALMEESVVDTRYGQFVNHDLAEYHVPVNADIGEIEALFLDEHDDKGNPLGIKGIGELGICGAGAAVANAVYNATGLRVREFPITLDKLLPALPQAALD